MKLFESVAKVGPEPTPASGHPSTGGEIKRFKCKSLCSPPWRGTRPVPPKRFREGGSGGWVRHRRKKTFTSNSIIIILLLIFLPFISSGKVFWSRFLTQGRSIFDTTGSWRQIYKAPLTINGARATLSIHGCDEPLELVKTRLKQSFGSSKKNYLIGPGFRRRPDSLEGRDYGGQVAGARSENSFWMLITASNHISRLLALAMPNSDKSLIFAIDQSPAEFPESTAVPPESIFSGYSLLPGSRVETIIKNEETGAALETRIADAAPDIIIGEISAKLSRHGWKQVCPSDNYGDSKKRFLIFQRGEALCTVMAGPALRENKSCVTILLKEKTGQ